MSTFDTKCNCCKKDLSSEPHFLDKLSKQKLCFSCSKVELAFGIWSKDNASYFLGEDLVLMDSKGKSINHLLAKVVNTEGQRAAHLLARIITLSVKAYESAMQHCNEPSQELPRPNENEDFVLYEAQRHLLDLQIDKALAGGDKALFMELTNQLHSLTEKVGVSNEPRKLD